MQSLLLAQCRNRALLRGFTCAVACLFVVGAAQAGVIPNIGGMPDLTSTVEFSVDASWQAQVHSYGFIGTAHTGDPVPPELRDPTEDETLFVYVIRMSDVPVAYPDSVNQFDISNFLPAVVNEVGFAIEILPNEGMQGEYLGARQNPSSVQSNQESRSVTYSYNGSRTLDPSDDPEGEFAVVFFYAEAPPGLVDATMTGGAATFDEQRVLGPVPEPSSIVLLGIGALVAIRRRRAGGS
jgi:hypothetical protein